MKVRFLKDVRVGGKEYHPGDVAELGEPTTGRLIERGYVEALETKTEVEEISPASASGIPIDFETVGDIGEVLPVEGEGEQSSIDDLLGVPIVIVSAKFDKGRSGKLEGKDIATIQFAKRDGLGGWFTTWSGPLIAQLKQLDEAGALPRKCVIEERKGSSGYRYYILASAKAQAREKQ